MLLCTIIYTAVYMYIQPYKDQWANILQTIVQVDILLMLAISSTDQFKVTDTVDIHSCDLTKYLFYNAGAISV